MRQISKHDVNKLSIPKLKASLPFEMTSDGEVIAVVDYPNDVNRTKLPELPLSKKRQTASVW